MTIFHRTVPKSGFNVSGGKTFDLGKTPVLSFGLGQVDGMPALLVATTVSKEIASRPDPFKPGVATPEELASFVPELVLVFHKPDAVLSLIKALERLHAIGQGEVLVEH